MHSIDEVPSLLIQKSHFEMTGHFQLPLLLPHINRFWIFQRICIWWPHQVIDVSIASWRDTRLNHSLCMHLHTILYFSLYNAYHCERAKCMSYNCLHFASINLIIAFDVDLYVFDAHSCLLFDWVSFTSFSVARFFWPTRDIFRVSRVVGVDLECFHLLSTMLDNIWFIDPINKSNSLAAQSREPVTITPHPIYCS